MLFPVRVGITLAPVLMCEIKFPSFAFLYAMSASLRHLVMPGDFDVLTKGWRRQEAVWR